MCHDSHITRKDKTLDLSICEKEQHRRGVCDVINFFLLSRFTQTNTVQHIFARILNFCLICTVLGTEGVK